MEHANASPTFGILGDFRFLQVHILRRCCTAVTFCALSPVNDQRWSFAFYPARARFCVLFSKGTSAF